MTSYHYGKTPSIGLIGCGFVGGAIAEGFKHYADIKIYDKTKDFGFQYIDVIKQDVVFVCLPTPMKSNGEVDLAILNAAIEEISETLPNDHSGKPIIIKSTIPPGTCLDLQRRCPNLFIIFNPEFLTERTASLDFMQQSRIILGTARFNTSRASASIFRNFSLLHFSSLEVSSKVFGFAA